MPLKRSTKEKLYANIFAVGVFLLCFTVTFFSSSFALYEENSDIDLYLLCQIALQITAFFIPGLIFIRFTGTETPKKSSSSPSAAQKLLLCFSVTLILICFSSLFILSQTDISNADSINVSDFADLLKIILVYCVSPAFFEEFVFRGILISYLKKHGAVFSVLFTALIFSFTHLSLPELPLYFIGGIFLGICAFICDSFLYSALAHFLYNIYTVFFAASMQGAVYSASVPFYVLVFGSVMLAGFIMLFYVCEHIFSARSAKNHIGNRKRSSVSLAVQFKNVLLSPVVIFCTAFCVIYTVLQNI